MARPIFDLQDLRYVIAVYETRGFSRAARRLDTVQSNVSARIIAMEKRLGVALFERLHRSGHRFVIPTAIGKRLHRSARKLVADHQALEQRAKRWRKRKM